MKKPESPLPLTDLITDLDASRLIGLITRPGINSRKYLHWDQLRRRPLPDGFNSHDEWWLVTKLKRQQIARTIPLRDCTGGAFFYCLTDEILEKLHIIDSQTRGVIGVSEKVINTGEKNRYVVSSLIEESITSSQLEGAATTRKVAAEMIRSGRSPRDKSEQMIMNNFRAMQRITHLKEEDVSSVGIYELHKVVTELTLENNDGAGQYQKPSDTRVQIFDDVDHQVLHSPPPAIELPKRMQSMCNFANETASDGQYMHPVIRAIILHFWLAYDHPFEDGNGRTARALFYWSMLRQGYWLFEFISISSLLKKAPSSYARAFLFTETDANDLTYFILHQLDVIQKSIKSLEQYIQRKTAESQALDNYLKNSMLLNHRQKALLANATKKNGTVYSIESHQRSHNIAYATSRADLLKLLELGFLKQFKTGKKFRFVAADDIETRLGRQVTAF